MFAFPDVGGDPAVAFGISAGYFAELANGYEWQVHHSAALRQSRSLDFALWNHLGSFQLQRWGDVGLVQVWWSKLAGICTRLVEPSGELTPEGLADRTSCGVALLFVTSYYLANALMRSSPCMANAAYGAYRETRLHELLPRAAKFPESNWLTCVQAIQTSQNAFHFAAETPIRITSNQDEDLLEVLHAIDFVMMPDGEAAVPPATWMRPPDKVGCCESVLPGSYSFNAGNCTGTCAGGQTVCIEAFERLGKLDDAREAAELFLHRFPFNPGLVALMRMSIARCDFAASQADRAAAELPGVVELCHRHYLFWIELLACTELERGRRLGGGGGAVRGAALVQFGRPLSQFLGPVAAVADVLEPIGVDGGAAVAAFSAAVDGV